ncbi:4253_t:CDS:1, partial [Acaulospora colombiana]
GTGNSRREDENDERGHENDKLQRPLFKDECFRKMELMIELLVYHYL